MFFEHATQNKMGKAELVGMRQYFIGQADKKFKEQFAKAGGAAEENMRSPTARMAQA